jgi:hypothetical protein
MTQQTPQKRKPKISLRVKIFIAFLIVGVPPVSIALGTAVMKVIDIREANVGTRFEKMAVWISEGIKARCRC